ncbi:putative transcriptional regulator/transcriptional regulator with XRE-family HTH domain [Rhodovulum iodosum]|uniref:Transcriptional regulator/transcriptional regulator with XRE-family HTH domain n=1 Tax=Rhodovulum iodosum TaxID=68291 RepID=A0ABV3XWL7_9RHOB|nr:short-chain fatty acyl-CoA regulator family protein [Rhodovulum robiginosum]RSK34195.1 XRE family transcriptional regulator [Rhodovulum robiginosum]
MAKALIGSQLRQLRRQHGHTQAEMARRLDISPAYVNLLENNQRALSVQVLMALTEVYGVDMRDLVSDRDTARLADLRAAVADPAFAEDKPDLQELRSVVDHAPRFADLFLHLYRSHRSAVDHLARMGGTGAEGDLLRTAPEAAIHDFFRDNRNYFDPLETAAEQTRHQIGGAPDDMYALLKRHLRVQFHVDVTVKSTGEMPDTLRVFDRAAGRVLLSQSLDHPNRVFQLAHVLALVTAPELLDRLTEASGIAAEATRARCRVELANYFAAALLMPYERFLDLAETTEYDIDRLAAAFGTTFEQVGHRLTTLQRDGARGVGFFLLRIDRAGNVTKRVNATAFALAEKGGACPVWNIHNAFATPGAILPQLVELPDGARYFTISRTSDRPSLGTGAAEARLVVALGCERSEAHRVGYARALNLDRGGAAARIGINCHLCPRPSCPQRAHQPIHMELPIDANRRGKTRYES